MITLLYVNYIIVHLFYDLVVSFVVLHLEVEVAP